MRGRTAELDSPPSWGTTPRRSPFPVRGVPGGWRDPWDDPDDSAELRVKGEAAERELEERIATMAPAWRQEIEGERRALARALRSASVSR